MRGLAQVVAGGGQEARLGLVGGFGRGLGLLHLLARLVKLCAVLGQPLLQHLALGLAGAQRTQGHFDRQQRRRHHQQRKGGGQPPRQFVAPEPGRRSQRQQRGSGSNEPGPPLPRPGQERDQAKRAHRAADPPCCTVCKPHPHPPP